MVQPMNDVTRILSAIEQGDPQAAEQLLPLVYDELRQLANHKLQADKVENDHEASRSDHAQGSPNSHSKRIIHRQVLIWCAPSPSRRTSICSPCCATSSAI